MRFHLVGLAHTQTIRAYSNCAFTELVRKMSDMLMDLGHEVILYASEDNDARCTELVTCITKDEQRELCNVTNPASVLNAGWSPSAPHWACFLRRATVEISKRIRPQDIILLSQGHAASPVIDAFPKHLRVEPIVGYTGFHESTYRVFPSQTWMHATYGKWYGCHGTRGRFYDRVIPHYFDVKDFKLVTGKKSYLAFMGRYNEDKGPQIAIQVAERLGVPLVIAGIGSYPFPSWVENRGLIGIEERSELMGNAAAVFAPSLYLEPFGKVAVEAQLCGTPAITTDWGAYPETVEQGIAGWRCHTFKDFVEAAKWALDGKADAELIRKRAIDKYSMEVIGPQYVRYFEELLTLFDRGWYTFDHVCPNICTQVRTHLFKGVGRT